MQVKNILYTITFLLFTFCTAQLNAKGSDSTSYRLQLGVLAGTDIGGAIPYPLSNIPSPFNAYPQIKPNFGAMVVLPFNKSWSIGTEVSYKGFGMKADARVENQKFNMDGGDVYFTGSAKMDMDFTILEVPLYAKYSFKNGNNKVLAGFYYSYTFTSEFKTTPQKGFIGSEPNKVEIVDVSNVLMDFDESLDNWDIGFLIGYERKIIDRLNIGLRVSVGFKDILKPSSTYFEYSMLPMKGTILLSYDIIKTKPLFKKRLASID